MPRIVISYRRADSSAIAGRIFDRLNERYGAGRIFMDIDEIPFGIDFREHLAGVLATCDAVVAVIGPHWATGGSSQPRIMDETDPVRIEIQAALARGIPIIPVLVEGGIMPGVSALPEPLAPLAFRNACEVASGRDFHSHVDRLIRAVDRLFPEPATSAPAAPVTVPPPAPEAEPRPEPEPASIAPGKPMAALPGPVPLGPAKSVLLAGMLLLPQVVQFTMRTELFVLAMFASTVGVVAILDDDRRPFLSRLGTGALAAFGNLLAQGALGVARASMLTW